MEYIKEMPLREKYVKALDSMTLHENFIISFILKHLDDQALSELKEIWRRGLKTITEDASYEEKYEITYSNWVWETKNAYSFVSERLGESGIEDFIRAEVEAHKKEYSGFVAFFLRLMRVFSVGSAFKMLANRVAYQMQWLTPFSVDELTQEKAVFNIPKCKLLDYPGTDNMCFLGCYQAWPTWMAEKFDVNLNFERQGKSCTMTLTP